jgi:hypothetical protein
LEQKAGISTILKEIIQIVYGARCESTPSGFFPRGDGNQIACSSLSGAVVLQIIDDVLSIS